MNFSGVLEVSAPVLYRLHRARFPFMSAPAAGAAARAAIHPPMSARLKRQVVPTLKPGILRSTAWR